MYHLFNRVYLDVDAFKTNKSNYYIASEAMAEAYGDGSANGPSLLGTFNDDQRFVDMDFLPLMKELKDSTDKIIVYVSRASYLTLVSKWVQSIFTDISTENLKALIYFEYLRLHNDGLNTPSNAIVQGEINGVLTVEPEASLLRFVQSVINQISMEYKILQRLKGQSPETLASDIRLFAERSSQHFVIDTQRNLESLFFNQSVQRRFGYNAKDYIGRMSVLPLIPTFKILIDSSLSKRLKSLSKTEIDDLVDDVGIYLEGMSEVEDTQRKAERSKLEIISNVTPLEDSVVVDRFISVLRASNEHTDYLDWDDVDMLNIPLIHYLVSLTDQELKGF